MINLTGGELKKKKKSCMRKLFLNNHLFPPVEQKDSMQSDTENQALIQR